MVLTEKGEHNKTCINCSDKKKEKDAVKTECGNCGCTVSKGTLSIHKRRFYCQVYNMEPKPDFEEWLINQGYDNMLHEYEDLLEYILTQKTNKPYNDITCLFAWLVGWITSYHS